MADNRNKKKNSSNYLKQGSILAVASIFVRVIGMLYRIPVTRIIGNEGNSFYSSAFDIYTIMLLVSSSAFHWPWPSRCRREMPEGNTAMPRECSTAPWYLPW